MKDLAVMAETRQPAYPEVPVIAEAGLGTGLEVQAWQGILVRVGTPPEIVEALHRAIRQVMAMPETMSRVEALAVGVTAGWGGEARRPLLGRVTVTRVRPKGRPREA